MSAPREPLRRVAIAGAGSLGLLAAIAVKRALPRCEVVVLGLPSAGPSLVDGASTGGAATRMLQERLGLAEDTLLRDAAASHRILFRLFEFAGEGRHAVFAPGGAFAAIESRFAQDWGRTRLPDTGQGPQLRTLAEALADSSHFSSDTPLDYALRWNGRAYHALLGARARTLGIGYVEDNLVAVQIDNAGLVTALRLMRSGSLTADLYIDCSGPSSLILSAHPAFEAEKWEDAIPPLFLHMAPPEAPLLALEDRLTRLPEGLLIESPGRDGLQVALLARADAGEHAIAQILGRSPAASIGVRAGRAARSWLGNVIGLGDAAARALPLLDLPLDLAHRQLELLLDMLPGRDLVAVEQEEYNRRAAAMADGVRDVQSAIVKAAGLARAVELPISVTTALDQLARHGRLPFREDAPLETADFASLLSALGYQRGQPLHAMASENAGDFGAWQKRLERIVAQTPPYQIWLQSRISKG